MSCFTLHARPVATLLLASLACSTTVGQTFIPIDHKGEPASSAITYYKNEGQIADENFEPVEDVIAHSFQASPQVFARAENIISLLVTARDTVIGVPDTTYRLDMRPIGENVAYVEPEFYEMVPDHHNYILAHCPQGIFNVRGYKRIVYKGVYPEIDFHLFSNAYGPKIYIVINPGGDPNDIQLEFTGQDQLDIDYQGYLEAIIGPKYIRLPEAIAYQQDGANTTQVPWGADYQQLNGIDQIGFYFGSYDPNLPLILDISASVGQPAPPWNSLPEWSTFYGEEDTDYATDMQPFGTEGMAVCGHTFSSMFPTSSGALFGSFQGTRDAYYSLFSDQYSRLYTTYYGGSGIDNANGIALTPTQDAVYLFGQTSSADMDYTQFSGSSFQDDSHNGNNCFIARFILDLDPNSQIDGHAEWETRMGMSNMKCDCIRTDAGGNVYVAGTGQQLGSLPFNTSLTCNGTNNSFPVCDIGGNAYFQPQPTGPSFSDAYIMKFDSDLQLVHSTLFGGSGGEDAYDLYIDNADDRVYMCGRTASERAGYNNCQPPLLGQGGFPLCDNGTGYFQDDLNGNNSGGANDAFLASFKTTTMELEHSTFVGSGAEDWAYAVAVAPSNGGVYLAGFTQAGAYDAAMCTPPTGSGLPNCGSGAQAHFPPGPGTSDGFIMRFDGVDRSLAWSSFIAGAGDEDCRDLAMTSPAHASSDYKVVVVGSTNSGPTGTVPFPLLSDQQYFFQGSLLNSSGYMHIFDQADEFKHGTYYGGGGGTTSLSSVVTQQQQRVFVAGSSNCDHSFPFKCPGPTAWCTNDYYNIIASGLSDAAYAQMQYDLSIGVDEVETSPTGHGWLMLPNPADDLLMISLTNDQLDTRGLQVQIYEARGRLAASEAWPSVGARTMHVPLHDLSKGLYLVRLFNASGLLGTSQPLQVE